MTIPGGERTILFVHPSDELYGADRCLLELVRGLPTDMRAIVVLPTDIAYEGQLSRQLTDAGATISRLDFAVLRRGALRPKDWPALIWRLAAGSWQIARLAKASDAAIIHTSTLAAISGPLAAIMARRRHVWHVHEDISDEHLLVRSVYQLLLALARGTIIANSMATARSLRSPKWLIRDTVAVVYPGVTTVSDTRSVNATGINDRRLSLGFVGRLAPRKGLGQLLEATALLRSNGIDVELSIFGSAPPGQEWREGQYRRRANGLGLQEIVRFEGFVDDVEKRLEGIDVLVVPSQRPEPFGLVLLEGMAAGCAVVASRNGGGSDEIMDHSMTGIYCGRTASSIAAAVERLARDPGLRERIGRQAQEAVRNRFTVEQYRSGILDVYRTISD